MQARSVLKRAPISAQKVRLVLNQIRGANVEKALNILSFSTKKAAALTLKLLNSAVSNAENNHNMDIDNLYVSKTFADESSTLKRTMPRAKGRADRILKRTSNITIEVMEKTGEKS